MTSKTATHRAAAILCTIMLCACSRAGAPSFDFFGAYFPAWLLCAAFGVVVGIFARVAMVATNLAFELPYQLALCTSIGLSGALLLWLAEFG